MSNPEILMNRFLLTALLCLSWLSWADDPASTAVRLNPDGVAIDGYSPISCFQKSVASAARKGFATDTICRTC